VSSIKGIIILLRLLVTDLIGFKTRGFMQLYQCAYKELLDLDSPKIIPNPKNANRHSIEQIERLAKIIDFQGQRSPVVISNLSGFIVKGHGRLEAIRLLNKHNPEKWNKVAIDFQDYLSEAQEYADLVADNEIARWAELDLHKVMFDLKEIDLGDIDLLGLENNDIFSDELQIDEINIEGEEAFDKELDEKSQYIVIYTDSKEEFKEMREKFKIESVINHLSPNPDNESHRLKVVNRLVEYSNIKEVLK
jgi:hypothetical protein